MEVQKRDEKGPDALQYKLIRFDSVKVKHNEMAAVSQRLLVINFLFSGRLPQIALLLLLHLSFIPSCSCIQGEALLFRVS